ncbi:MAG: methionyl aminopeptidase [Candidatus Berkelbacteria bacterium Licking1014_96]|uniref:Methionine aminopeptidase n=1 Tax=Candidatus Berkelbacteria bacterium Licking1014_96 TaxID=2017149 RepID=A0A554LHA9_9BACT|nr:MAG: methionyl aminopeptidase [Candidatus Berkelbacteria bacterium Licking1014_96]
MAKIYNKKEIEILREGGRRLASVVKAIKLEIKAGSTGLEIDELAFNLMREIGGRPSFLHHDGFPASICLSINEEVVHSVPSKRKFEDGDLVGIDAGLFFRGLHTDMAATVAVGRIDQKIKRFVKTAKKTLEIAIKQALPGKTTGDIGFAIQDFVEKQGFSVVKELSGHGVGHQLHEKPIIPNFGKKGKGTRLLPGMVIAIEPIINLSGREIETAIDGWRVMTKDGSPSAHFEHTILITKNGNEILTLSNTTKS